MEASSSTTPLEVKSLSSPVERAGRSTHSETCGAPICFERPGITDEPYFWYPGEDICGYRDVSLEQRHVRIIQKRITRRWRVLPPEPGFGEADIGYFTFENLAKRQAVRKGVRGRDREAQR